MRPFLFSHHFASIIALCFFIIPIIPGTICSQANRSSSAIGTFNGSLDHPATFSSDRGFILTQLYEDMRYLSSEPDFLLVVGGLAAAPQIFSTAFDNESAEITELWGQSKFADNTFELGETIGDGAFPVALSAATWGLGKVSGSSRLSDFGSDLFRVQVINGLVTGALKFSTNRTRPDGAAYSFPSGHTSSAFASAGVVYRHFGATYGLPAFALAGYIGLSRLQEGKHYLSDVFAGGIVGSFISLKLSDRDERGGPLTVKPSKVADGYGLKFSYKF